MSAVVVWCLCSWAGWLPRHRRSELCHPGVWAGPSAPFPVALQLPDPARDARIARRRAADRAAASRALDRVLADWAEVPDLRAGVCGREMRCVASVDVHVSPHTCGYQE